MASKDKIDNGIPIQTMKVSPKTIITMLSLWTSINLKLVKTYPMMMAHISIEIKKLTKIHRAIIMSPYAIQYYVVGTL